MGVGDVGVGIGIWESGFEQALAKNITIAVKTKDRIRRHLNFCLAAATAVHLYVDGLFGLFTFAIIDLDRYGDGVFS